jgi:hypothetical protein
MPRLLKLDTEIHFPFLPFQDAEMGAQPKRRVNQETVV